jgi:hypothetical protein
MTLRFIGWKHYAYPRDPWRWFRILDYDVEDPAADSARILESLLLDPDYPDTLMGPEPSPWIHMAASKQRDAVRGPYLVSKLTPDSYERVSPEVAQGILDESLGREIPPATAEEVGVARVFSETIRGENELLRLRDDPSAWHGLAFLKIVSDFEELVVLDRRNKRLRVVAAGHD